MNNKTIELALRIVEQTEKDTKEKYFRSYWKFGRKGMKSKMNGHHIAPDKETCLATLKKQLASVGVTNIKIKEISKEVYDKWKADTDKYLATHP